MKALKLVSILIAAVLLVAVGFVYAGIFNIAADEPHWRLTHRLIESTRNRSIAVRARDIETPPLEDAQLIAHGAEAYEEMCIGCHLAPGMRNTPARAGLYPSPPELAEHGADRSASETFWIIKHGLKMTGMPAWGLTHHDQSIWSMVAFLQKLPQLSADEYRELVAQGGGSHSHEEEDGEEDHEADGQSHDAASSRAGASVAVPAEATAPVTTVDTFMRLLASGNTRSASELLDPEVLIFESGGAERSRQEYASHHLGSDAAFLKNAKHRLLARKADSGGELAWVASEARLSSSSRGRAVEMVTTETMMLRKTAAGWRIVHIHWSNRPAAEGA